MSRCALARAGPLEPEGTRTGTGDWPAASAAKCRPGEEMVGPPPVEAAQLPAAGGLLHTINEQWATL